MSHVVKIKTQIKSLEALEKAANKCGLELKRGQKTYKWFENFVGDSPMPDGFTWHGKSGRHEFDPTKRMLGTCDHALRVKGDNGHAYEIGVYEKEDGTWGLVWDWWSGGYGLCDHINKGPLNSGNANADLLLEEYALQAATIAAEQQGWYVERQGQTLTIHGDGGVITVGAGGDVEAKNFQGGACTAPVMLLTEAMGKVNEMANTTEFFEQENHLTVAEEE